MQCRNEIGLKRKKKWKEKVFFSACFLFLRLLLFSWGITLLWGLALVSTTKRKARCFFFISTPYHPMKRNLYFCERWRVEVGCVDGGSREWIYLHLSKLVSGVRLFSFLEMFFAKNEYVIFFFVSANKVILELVYLKWTKNLNILKKLILGFGQFCGLTVVFQIFKLVYPCFGRVWTLFSALKNLLLQVFLAPKVVKRPPNLRYSVDI